MIDDPEPFPLADMDAWEDFARENREALIEQCGSVAAALKVCCDGGLVMGGGACPATHVFFVEG